MVLLYSEMKFITTHTYLIKKLQNNAGNLKKKDLKILTNNLNKYCSFGLNESKYIFKKNTPNFIVLDMSLNEFNSKNAVNATILFNEKLQYGYNINLNDSNTYHKIITNELYVNRFFFNDLTSLSAVDYCKNEVTNVIPQIFTKVGEAPSESKIIIAQEQSNLNMDLMFVFYNNQLNEKRVLYIAREKNYESIVKYYEEKDAILVGDWKKSANPSSGNFSIITKLTCNETFNAYAIYNLTTDVQGYYDVYVKGTHSNKLYRISNVECFATDIHGIQLARIDQTDPNLNQQWVKICTLYVDTKPSANIKITNSGGETSTQHVSVDSLKLVKKF